MIIYLLEAADGSVVMTRGSLIQPMSAGENLAESTDSRKVSALTGTCEQFVAFSSSLTVDSTCSVVSFHDGQRLRLMMTSFFFFHGKIP